jgi:hypothetical protein
MSFSRASPLPRVKPRCASHTPGQNHVLRRPPLIAPLVGWKVIKIGKESNENRKVKKKRSDKKRKGTIRTLPSDALPGRVCSGRVAPLHSQFPPRHAPHPFWLIFSPRIHHQVFFLFSLFPPGTPLPLLSLAFALVISNDCYVFSTIIYLCIII